MVSGVKGLRFRGVGCMFRGQGCVFRTFSLSVITYIHLVGGFISGFYGQLLGVLGMLSCSGVSCCRGPNPEPQNPQPKTPNPNPTTLSPKP